MIGHSGSSGLASTDDQLFMRRALELAARGRGQTAPNPNVGAVVVKDGRIVGEGFHARYGMAHAEVAALANAGRKAKGSTVYVTLEPCSHHGKTPPCTGALLAAGVTRVVYAVNDPNPIAAGGAQWLRAAGVEVTGNVLRDEAAELIAPFLYAASGATRPFVVLKLAISIDGAIVDASRARGWLTGEKSRHAVHGLRAASDAVAVGIGTVLSDDPALTVRDAPAPRVAPTRVVFDRVARLPHGSALAKTANHTPVLVFHAPTADKASADRVTHLTALGVDCHAVRSMPEAMQLLRARGVQQLLVEGGAALASAFLHAGLVDRLITFQAPVILGSGALGAFSELPPQVAAGAPRWKVVSRQELDDDLMTIYAPPATS